MTSVRRHTRTDGWTRIDITWEERKKLDITHLFLFEWAQDHCVGKFVSTIAGSSIIPTSVFVFENESDASMFALKWK